MSAEITDKSGGILTAGSTGKLTQPELAALQQTVGELIQQQGKARLLVVADKFEGWQRGGDWGDLSFSMNYDDRIEKLAIVGDRQWEDLALVFASKGLRRFPIEYFPPADVARARAWLAEPAT